MLRGDILTFLQALKEWTPADIVACATGLLNERELNILTAASIPGTLLTLVPDPVGLLASVGVSTESATALWKKISLKRNDSSLINAMEALRLANDEKNG